MKCLQIFTDGSSLGNPGPGGYAAIIVYDGREIIVRGGEARATNNRMEMLAIIQALEWVSNEGLQAPIELFSDSRLIVESLNKNWKRKANLDLWERLDRARKKLQSSQIRFQWVKGHANHSHNNRCDRIAVEEAGKQKKKIITSYGKTLDAGLFGKDAGFLHCAKCGKKTTGLYGLLTDSGMIRVDCAECGNYLIFAPKTSENKKKALLRPLISKEELKKVVQLRQSAGRKIAEKDLQKMKAWTQKQAREFLKKHQTLF